MSGIGLYGKFIILLITIIMTIIMTIFMIKNMQEQYTHRTLTFFCILPQLPTGMKSLPWTLFIQNVLCSVSLYPKSKG